MKEQQDPIINLSAVLNCSPERAFDFFVDGNLLTQWLTEKAVVELIPGGKYELFWSPDDPDLTNESTYGCKILAFERGQFLNVEWRGNSAHKHFMNHVRPLTNVTVMFFKLDSSRTKVTLLHTGWRQDEHWEAARMFFIQAWTGAFQQLESLLAHPA
jgi:uncharacterized protein YndB with AHSA1/START domain